MSSIEIDITKGAYIMSIDARYLYRYDNPEIMCLSCNNKGQCDKKSVCKDYSEYYDNKRLGYDSNKMTMKLLNKNKREIAKKLRYTYIKKHKPLPEGKGRPKKEDKFKLGLLYKVKMPYSLELIEFYKLAENEFLMDDFNKQYTNAIINVNFSGAEKEKVIDKDTGEIKQELLITGKKYKYSNRKMLSIKQVDKLKISKSVKALRNHLYNKGFYLDGYHYVNFMRSTSKSRQSRDLFVKEEYLDTMLNWARIGVKFHVVTEEEIVNGTAIETDIAGLRAHESLVLSEIQSTININHDEILLISDIESPFMKKCSVTEMTNGRAKAQDKEIEIKNNIFDGQGLMHYSKFPFEDTTDENGETKQYGMMLLRNRFFKCCVFNTNIQTFLNDFLTDEEKEFGYIPDMVGRLVDIKKIKLITTPSSLKFLKYYKVEDHSKKAAYEYWLENLDTTFGVVKTEHASKDFSRTLAYQVINSLPLSKDDVRDLMKEEFDYISLLKNNPVVVQAHIGDFASYDKDYAFNLMIHNEKVVKTRIYEETRNKLVEKYIENLRTGDVRVGKTDFSTMVANPFEMLLHSIGKYNIDTDKPLHGKREIWCPGFADRIGLFGARYPQVCSGNIIHLTNVHHNEFDKYFNFTKNIVVMNFINDDVPDRLQGCDTDSDSILLSANRVLESKARICDNDENGFLTPVNRIKPTDGNNKTERKRYYNAECMSNVDHAIAQNFIGRIINWSQILNSYFWHTYFNDILNQELKDAILKDFYDKISMLSSLSQIEIDKAKKFFEVNALQELKSLMEFDRLEEYKKTIKVQKKKIMLFDDDAEIDESSDGMKLSEYMQKYGNTLVNIKENHNALQKEFEKINDNATYEEVDKYKQLLKDLYKDLSDSLSEETKDKETITYPKFFKYIGQGGDHHYDYFDCPMDYLEQILDEIPRKIDIDTYDVKLKDIFTIKPKDNHRREIDKIGDIVCDMDSDLDAMFLNGDDEDYRVLAHDRFQEAVEEVKHIKINPETIQAIFRAVYGNSKQNKKLKSCKKRLLNVLYQAHPEKFLAAFQKSDEHSYLTKDENGDIEIFGNRYSIKRKSSKNKDKASA